MENELFVWVMALVVKRTGADCGGLVPSIVVGRTVPGVMEVEADDNVCWLVCVLAVIEDGVTEEVDDGGSCVGKAV